MENDFTNILEQDQAMVEAHLAGVFQNDPRYADLQEAMEYSLLSGGKRIRPVLTLETCRMCGGTLQAALPFACGVEMIHTYSLIHDDLPAMDNADLRRGCPTNHAVYGEATAILAGDGLLTAAFGQLAGASLPSECIVAAVSCLSAAAGPVGMVAGQAMDMAGEGRALTREELELLQSLKTGALISASAELGCLAAGGGPEQMDRVRRYAQTLGRAFQVRDDVLDVISSDQELGKTVGSDRANEKSTFVTALGLDGSEALVEHLTQMAIDALDGFEHPEFHIWLAQQMAQRKT
ncbi:MAG: farnesyl diphosphate synthase [Lawsonibacter sp.]|nr:farnesyl diphosphate synthase [Lawsonibacter sp.]